MLNVAIVLNAPTLTAKITEDIVIFVDGGYRFAGDKKPFAVIGDFDSLGEIPSGVRVIKHNPEKNYTDGEAAVRYAAEAGADGVAIYGALGGRIDHVLGNLSLLVLAKKLGIKAIIKEKNVKIRYCEGKISLPTGSGRTVSVIPVGGSATVTDSEGLKYPLDNLKLEPFDTRGISNKTTADTFKCEVISGGVYVITYD